MSNPNVKTEKAASSSSFSSLFATILIPVALLIGVLVYMFILGNPSNFEGGDPSGHPKPGNIQGMMYKGGYLVPVLMACMLIVIAVVIERFCHYRRSKRKRLYSCFREKSKRLPGSQRHQWCNC